MNALPIRIVIADDHQLVRQGIRSFIETHADLVIIGEAEDADSAVALCAELQPAVALVDLVMPGGGIEATRGIRAASPATQVVLLTSFEAPDQLEAAIRAGALSCLLKDIDSDVLAEVLRKAARGEAVLHPRLAAGLVEALQRERGGTAAAAENLSQREHEVLALIAEGLSNRRIAERLGIGEKTVKTHVSNLLSKLEVSDRTQAAVFAWRSGLKQPVDS